MLCVRSHPHNSTGVSNTILALCCVVLFCLLENFNKFQVSQCILLCKVLQLYFEQHMCSLELTSRMFGSYKRHTVLWKSYIYLKSYNLVFFLTAGLFSFQPCFVATKEQFLSTAPLTSLLQNDCIDRTDEANSSKYKSSMH